MSISSQISLAPKIFENRNLTLPKKEDPENTFSKVKIETTLTNTKITDDLRFSQVVFKQTPKKRIPTRALTTQKNNIPASKQTDSYKKYTDKNTIRSMEKKPLKINTDNDNNNKTHDKVKGFNTEESRKSHLKTTPNKPAKKLDIPTPKKVKSRSPQKKPNELKYPTLTQEEKTKTIKSLVNTMKSTKEQKNQEDLDTVYKRKQRLVEENKKIFEDINLDEENKDIEENEDLSMSQNKKKWNKSDNNGLNSSRKCYSESPMKSQMSNEYETHDNYYETNNKEIFRGGKKNKKKLKPIVDSNEYMNQIFPEREENLRRKKNRQLEESKCNSKSKFPTPKKNVPVKVSHEFEKTSFKSAQKNKNKNKEEKKQEEHNKLMKMFHSLQNIDKKTHANISNKKGKTMTIKKPSNNISFYKNNELSESSCSIISNQTNIGNNNFFRQTNKTKELLKQRPRDIKKGRKYVEEDYHNDDLPISSQRGQYEEQKNSKSFEDRKNSSHEKSENVPMVNNYVNKAPKKETEVNNKKNKNNKSLGGESKSISIEEPDVRKIKNTLNKAEEMFRSTEIKEIIDDKSNDSEREDFSQKEDEKNKSEEEDEKTSKHHHRQEESKNSDSVTHSMKSNKDEREKESEKLSQSMSDENDKEDNQLDGDESIKVPSTIISDNFDTIEKAKDTKQKPKKKKKKMNQEEIQHKFQTVFNILQKAKERNFFLKLKSLSQEKKEKKPNTNNIQNFLSIMTKVLRKNLMNKFHYYRKVDVFQSMLTRYFRDKIYLEFKQKVIQLANISYGVAVLSATLLSHRFQYFYDKLIDFQEKAKKEMSTSIEKLCQILLDIFVKPIYDEIKEGRRKKKKKKEKKNCFDRVKNLILSQRVNSDLNRSKRSDFSDLSNGSNTFRNPNNRSFMPNESLLSDRTDKDGHLKPMTKMFKIFQNKKKHSTHTESQMSEPEPLEESKRGNLLEEKIVEVDTHHIDSIPLVEKKISEEDNNKESNRSEAQRNSLVSSNLSECDELAENDNSGIIWEFNTSPHQKEKPESPSENNNKKEDESKTPEILPKSSEESIIDLRGSQVSYETSKDKNNSYKDEQVADYDEFITEDLQEEEDNYINHEAIHEMGKLQAGSSSKSLEHSNSLKSRNNQNNDECLEEMKNINDEKKEKEEEEKKEESGKSFEILGGSLDKEKQKYRARNMRYKEEDSPSNKDNQNDKENENKKENPQIQKSNDDLKKEINDLKNKEEEEKKKKEEEEKKQEEEKEEEKIFDKLSKEDKDKLINEILEETMKELITTEVDDKDKKIIKPKEKIKREAHSQNISLSASTSSLGGLNQQQNNVSLSLEEINNSIFMRTVNEIKKDQKKDQYVDRKFPIVLNKISDKIDEDYSSIIQKLKQPYRKNPEQLVNDIMLQNEKVLSSLNFINQNEINQQEFLPKSTIEPLSAKNTTSANTLNNSNIEFNEYDEILNEAILDAVNEIIQEERQYGKLGEPLPWSTRQREINYKYRDNKFCLGNFKKKILNSLKSCNETRIGLIPENNAILESQQITQERDLKIKNVAHDELKNTDDEFKCFENEETQIRLLLSKIIMEQLMNEVVEILEHVQYSRREPNKYENKSIYACENIPKLAFQLQNDDARASSNCSREWDEGKDEDANVNIERTDSN